MVEQGALAGALGPRDGHDGVAHAAALHAAVPDKGLQAIGVEGAVAADHLQHAIAVGIAHVGAAMAHRGLAGPGEVARVPPGLARPPMPVLPSRGAIKRECKLLR